VENDRSGIVYLVGAGPGDPGLITVKGIECLRRADVVIHDRLINVSLLSYAPQAEFIDVGKQPDRHPVKQSQINQLLVNHAQAGKTVVRLKGGDPFVFGRGGEEAMALSEAGIAFQVVPGISSAIAAPAYAGIPITHRGIACSAAVITGHRADCTSDPDSDWARAARGVDTLVFLMGVQNLPRIVEQMLAAGRSPSTPIALIEQATCRSQKTVAGTLADIVSRAAQVCPPAVIVIGEVVALRKNLRWYDVSRPQPFDGVCVFNTRPVRPAFHHSTPLVGSPDKFTSLLADSGARVIDFPTTALIPNPDPKALSNLFQRLPSPHPNHESPPWLLFGDENEVRFFMEELFAQGYDVRRLSGASLAALSLAAARALREFGLRPDLITSVSADLAGSLACSGAQSVVLLSTDSQAGLVRSSLESHGLKVEHVPVYTIEPFEEDPAAVRLLFEHDSHILALFSPTAVVGLANILRASGETALPTTSTIICSGEATIEAAVQLGFKVDLAVEENAPPAALVEVLARWQER
jgi:uroporphyrinogen III methyltransferase / synthase